MHAHSEHARTALAVLRQCKSLTGDKAELIEKSIVTLDRELDEANTILVKTLSRADMIVPDVDLPPAYYTNGERYEPAERKIMTELLAAKGRCVCKRALFEAVVLDAETTDDWLNLVSVRVCRLRKKLGRIRFALKAAGLPSYINTYWGEGFSLTSVPTIGRDGRATVKGSTRA